MPGKQVIFYKISSAFIDVIIKLSVKLYESGEKVLIWLDNDEVLKELDTKLWTFSKLAFIPHGSRQTTQLEHAERCVIWLTRELDILNNSTILIHNQTEILDDKIQSFDQILDICSTDDTKINSRSEYYRQIGFGIQKLWIQKGNTWEKGDIL